MKKVKTFACKFLPAFLLAGISGSGISNEKLDSLRSALFSAHDSPKYEIYVRISKAYRNIHIDTFKNTLCKTYPECHAEGGKKVTAHLPDHFVLFKPKDIVSGDFYWALEKNNGTQNLWHMAAADCTGHGAPGAFLTMLGMSFLNKIVISSGIIHPSEILNELRSRS